MIIIDLLPGDYFYLHDNKNQFQFIRRVTEIDIYGMEQSEGSLCKSDRAEIKTPWMEETILMDLDREIQSSFTQLKLF